MIDWGLEKPVAVGFDLGQVLIGLAHANGLSIETMPEIEHTIVPAYSEFAAEGGPRDEHIVREGFVASLTCRSALSANPFLSRDSDPSTNDPRAPHPTHPIPSRPRRLHRVTP